jgi:hypothetical protein
MRIRNLWTHAYEPDRAEAMDALAALSLLARWVDEAQVTDAQIECNSATCRRSASTVHLAAKE